MVVSNIVYFHPYLRKIPILTNIFEMGWFNHQPVMLSVLFSAIPRHVVFFFSAHFLHPGHGIHGSVPGSSTSAITDVAKTTDTE